MQEEEKAPEEGAQEEGQFEMTPGQATGMGRGARSPGLFNRRRALIALCTAASVAIGGALLSSTLRPPKKDGAAESGFSATNAPTEFITALQDRSLRRRAAEPDAGSLPMEGQGQETGAGPALPPVSFNAPPEAAPQQQQQPPPPQQAPQPQPAQAARPPEPAYFRSSLIPQMQGSLLPAQAPQGNAAQSPAYGNPAPGPAPQGGRQEPYGGGAATGGQFLGENALWAGTIIPGILLTSINTDLPGNVLARVTQNVFDSQTGRSLLVPQGTVLLARYGSSVSLAQHRVQIAWDTMIRPDGFQIDLGGANGVDLSGMSGQAAQYDENWFEYLKAAGIVALFSVANASMTESAEKHATEASAANIAEANSRMVGELGGNLAARAMDIQPTLTVSNGTPINVMLSGTLYLPPLPPPPAAQRFTLERPYAR